MTYLAFAAGLAGGALALYLWQTSSGTFPKGMEAEANLRLAALEETVGYLTMRLEEIRDNQTPAEMLTKVRGQKPGKATVPKGGPGNQVARLAAQGFGAQEISRELGLPRGQVDLALRLHTGDD